MWFLAALSGMPFVIKDPSAAKNGLNEGFSQYLHLSYRLNSLNGGLYGGLYRAQL